MRWVHDTSDGMSENISSSLPLSISSKLHGKQRQKHFKIDGVFNWIYLVLEQISKVTFLR